MPKHIIHSGSICRNLVLLLYIACLKTAHNPLPLKQALILPIHKGKDNPMQVPGNYRGISPTSSLSKLLELLLKPYVELPLHISNTLDKLPFGFHKGRSCIMASTNLQLIIELNTFYKRPTFIALLHAQKAFNSVWHNGLFQKHQEHMEVEAQTEGDLRLVDGSSDLEGRLEIYHNYAWGTICDDYFDLADADVACRQLGFTSALAVKERAYFGSGVSGTVIWLDNVDCTGRESMLTHCEDRGWGVTNCGHNEDVGIICTYSSAREGDLRLVDGEDLDEGRVEIYHNGVWGTICNDFWAYDEARVACRQLGYNGVTYSYVRYDPGQDPIHLDNVMCYGYEARLIDCYSMVWGNANCGHNEDVGINCARSNSNSNLEGWAISLIVIGSLLFFGLFAVVVGKVCSKPRSKRNASSAVITSNETAPVQTYPMQVGSAYPPPTTSYPPQAASTAPMTAPYPPNAMAFQAYPPTVSGMSAAPPAYYPVPTVPTGNPTSMPLPGSGEAASSP